MADTSIDHAALDEAWALVAQGNRDAFTDILARTHRSLRMFITARLPNPELVEEVLQQTYVVAFEQRHATVDPGKVLAYLRGIARNMTARCWREIQRGERHVDALDHCLFGDMLSPAELHDHSEQAQQLEQVLATCLSRLKDRPRKIFLAAYEEEMSHKRLAQRFSMRVAAISRLLFKTRGLLKECLQSKGVQAP